MKPRLSLLDLLTAGVFAVQASLALHLAINGSSRPLPLHWNAQGQVDRWGDSRDFALIFGLLTVLGLIVSVAMSVASHCAEHAGDMSRARSLRIGQGVSLFTVATLSLTIATVSLGGVSPGSEAGVTMAGLSLIFLGMGAFLGRISPNPLIGVRTPWSYKSRLAWDRSNRLAGRLFFLLGMAGLVAAPVAPQPHATFAVIVAVLVIAAWSGFESWRVWREDPNRMPF